MSAQPHTPPPHLARHDRVQVRPFTAPHAALVASWVRDAREAFWVAPRSRPPLTAAVVESWRSARGDRFLLYAASGDSPLGYGEVNALDSRRGSFWLGHLLVDPQHRGRGYGVALVRLLSEAAFTRRAARELSLVVFPENTAAIACYRRAGFRDDGCEVQEFAAYQKRVMLLRMVTTAPQY